MSDAAGGEVQAGDAGGGDAASDAGMIGCSAICPGPTSGPATGSGACVNSECRISCNGSYPTLCTASNACVDVQTDAKNCGKCGHDCLGGECVGGQCQPVVIAQYTGNPQIIYVGSQYIYVTTDLGYVGRANKNGSDLKPFAMPAFASSVYYGTILGEDNDRVFLARWVGSPFQLSICQTSGCDVTATSIGGAYTQYFAVDQLDHKVVWVEYSPSRLVAASTTGSVSPIDVPGGALTAGSNGSRLFYTHGGIYFADGSSINRIPVAGGLISGVTTGNGNLTILGANTSSLFLYDGSAIGAVPLPSGDGGMPKLVITTAMTPTWDGNFAADDTSLYWVSNGRVESCQSSDCAGTLKAPPQTAQGTVSDVGIDDAAVYWLAASSIPGSPRVGCTVSKWAR